MKKILSAAFISAMTLNQTNALAFENTYQNTAITTDESTISLTNSLRALALEIASLVNNFEGSEGDQIIETVEGLIAAIEARNGEEVFNKGRELLQLIAQIAQNDDINIQEGLDHVARLVDAIRNKDSRSAAAAITDLALFVARIAKGLNN